MKGESKRDRNIKNIETELQNLKILEEREDIGRWRKGWGTVDHGSGLNRSNTLSWSEELRTLDLERERGTGWRSGERPVAREGP